MSERAPAWVVPVMRAGYSARAAIYVIIGILALLAAWRGGEAEGTKGALESLRGSGWGIAALWAIAIGLFAYAIWRLICAWMDLERRGTDAKGIIARIGQTVTGLIHGGLGVQAVALAMGNGSSGEGSGTEGWTAKLLALPFGQWLVGIAGLIVIGAGGYYAYKGWSGKYRKYLRWTPTMEKLTPACTWGNIAEGIVIAIIGGFLIFAALHSNAQEAGGIGDAFAFVRQQAYGRILLGLLALGMLCFAVYNAIEAVYRIVPARAGDDVQTLAKRAELQARRAVS